ncbi:MAG: M3 family metallopeptidase [Bacteroidales bacterium]|jgi:peptidyl-dipeptidase Dcp|nr:M3 family metallopeptidase [Bacteroidales bacterium]
MKKIKFLFVVFLGILLIYSCNKKSENSEMTNPLLQTWDTPFEVPPFDKIQPEHYLPAFYEAMNQQDAEIAAIVNSIETPNFINTIEALEYSGNTLSKISNIFFNILETNSNDEMQAIADSISPILSSHEDKINLNKELFAKIKTVYENRDKENLSREQNSLLDEYYKNFVRGGANLPEGKQERFKEINMQISTLALKFNKNVLDATNAYKLIIDKEEDLSGLPQSIRDAAKDSVKNIWTFTLDNPSLLPFLQYSSNREKRKEIWTAYSSRCNGGEFDNNEIITQLVNLRTERAQMLGYKSHADFVLDDAMAKNSKAVYDLLIKVWEPSVKKADEERKMYQQKAGTEKIQPYDWSYYAEIIRNEKYNLNEDSIKQYFSLDNVKNAVFTCAEKLYGLTFVENPKLPTYDTQAVAYEVKNNNEIIAILYMDFYVRPSKSSGAWMTEFRSQHQTQDGKNVIPIVSLVLNFPNPTANTPSLLNFDETETLFHEFGHALHGMLSKCRYNSIAGTNVPRDFVEFPSQFNENFATDKEVLKTYAKHYITGEIIPDVLIDQIEKAENFGQGFMNTELIAASLLDMDYHCMTEIKTFNPNEFENAAMQKYGLISEIIPRYKSQYFKHIFTSTFGYSAGYYSYTWAAVIEADAFELFKEKGIFNKETADSFRKNILEIGNTDNLMTRYKTFRGQEPEVYPLLKKRGLIE